ncbi:MAG TPA: xanthine dehydrogenase family protein subunit M [archaeon]|nr:xanthine dehydrogenase family protein subunit M [archaeon]
MKAFSYYNPTSIENAVAVLGKEERDSRALAGGTDLIGEIKNRYLAPDCLVNLKAIRGLEGISFTDREGLKIGPLATLTELAENKTVSSRYPGLAEAALSVGTPQLRNMGTVGGNICQRPRCWYYRGVEYPCLRKFGDTCYAVSGRNKYHAVIDGGPCFIVHPSDLAPMLMAFGASLTIRDSKNARVVPMDQFFVLPADDPTRENILKKGELITQITVPPPPANAKSCYLKFKERESRDFALASAAVVLEMDGKTCRKASLVLGGVSPAPHRAKKAEQALSGRELTLSAVEKAAEDAVSTAEPLEENKYKLRITKTILKRAVLRAAGVKI